MTGLYSPKFLEVNKFERCRVLYIILFMAFVPPSTVIARNPPS